MNKKGDFKTLIIGLAVVATLAIFLKIKQGAVTSFSILDSISSGGTGSTLGIVAIGGILVALILLIVLLTSKKKSNSGNQEQEDEDDDDEE